MRLNSCCGQVRVADSVPQQHDRLEARPAGLAGGGGGRQERPGGDQRPPAGRGEEKGGISHQLSFSYNSKYFLISGVSNPYNAMIDRHVRKRTSIAAPEKRSLEAYFAVQPRPSGEKIAAIAEKLDLKKNVVRVWFCNQRQKQKRMKFAAQGGIH